MEKTLFIGLKTEGVDHLAIEGGEATDDFHITLVWGKFEHSSDDDDLQVRIQSVIEKIKDAIPDKISLDSLGRFPASDSSDGKDVIYARVKSGQLESLRRMAIRELKKNGIKVKGTFSVYRPHMTLAYIHPNEEFPLHRMDETADITKLIYAFSPDESVEKSRFEIKKADEDKRLVFGWANIATRANGEVIQDWQDDIVEPEDLEEAVYEYVLNFRNSGEEHQPGLRKKGRMVESVVFTEEKLTAMGIPKGTVPLGWWVGFYIDDDEAWEKVKNGTYTMFSVEGSGQRVPADDLDTRMRKSIAKSFSELAKFNPYHGRDGRFTGPGGAASFTYSPGKSKAHDNAIAREKARMSAYGEKLSSPYTVVRGGKQYRITEISEKNGQKTCAAEYREPGKEWKTVSDEKTLHNLRTAHDASKKYEKYTDDQLKAERDRLKGIEDSNYQQFTRAAASRSGSMVENMTDAQSQRKIVEDVIRNRKNSSSQSTPGSGETKAISVDMGNGRILTYRERNGHITEINDSVPKNTNNLSLSQIMQRAKDMGYKVTTYDAKQLQDYDVKRQKERKETNALLDHMSAKDRSSTYMAPRKGWKGH